MFSFLLPKTRLQAYDIKEVPIEKFEIIGISQINPYYNYEYNNNVFLTVVNLANYSRNCDEQEGMILTKYFTKRRCPKCRKIELLPVKLRLNFNSNYLKNPQEYSLDFSYDSKYNFPSCAHAYCTNCCSCFEVHIKNNDTWVKEAKHINPAKLVASKWDEYQVE